MASGVLPVPAGSILRPAAVGVPIVGPPAIAAVVTPPVAAMGPPPVMMPRGRRFVADHRPMPAVRVVMVRAAQGGQGQQRPDPHGHDHMLPANIPVSRPSGRGQPQGRQAAHHEDRQPAFPCVFHNRLLCFRSSISMYHAGGDGGVTGAQTLCRDLSKNCIGKKKVKRCNRSGGREREGALFFVGKTGRWPIGRC